MDLATGRRGEFVEMKYLTGGGGGVGLCFGFWVGLSWAVGRGLWVRLAVLRVAGCGLQAAGCGLRVAGCGL